jgi:integrase
MSKHRGVYERELGSGVWWIHYFDAEGRRRREKVGRRSDAVALYMKRKADALAGKKLPERLRQKAVMFNELADDALEYAKAHKLSWEDDEIRLKKIRETFGTRTAESITPQDIERWFLAQNTDREKKWKPATFNRYKALFSLVYKLGVNNGKVKSNPARLVQGRRENNARDRYLLPEEEDKLRAVIEKNCPERMPELDIAINTGMRRAEQYTADWTWVDFENRMLTVPRSKHGEKRRVYLNDVAVGALRTQWRFSEGKGRIFAHLYQSNRTKGAREWFERALLDAGITNFRWHDLRHTFGSRLVAKGVDIYTVKELMGHKTISVTMRYAHLAPQHQLAAVQRLCDTGPAAQAEPRATRTATDVSGEVAPSDTRPN